MINRKKGIIMKFKYINQALLYLIEIAFVTSTLVYISQRLKVCTDWYEVFERYTAVFVVYQGLVLLFNSNFLDAKKDIYLAYKTYLKKCLLFVEYKDYNLLNQLKSSKSVITSNTIFIDKNYINKFNKIYDLLVNTKKTDKEKEFVIKCEIIQMEHNIEYQSLKWRFSLLVKLFK